MGSRVQSKTDSFFEQVKKHCFEKKELIHRVYKNKIGTRQKATPSNQNDKFNQNNTLY